jgi:hypothetical protein
MPTASVTTGNVSVGQPDYCYTLVREIQTTLYETSPSPIYTYDGSLTSNKVIFDFSTNAAIFTHNSITYPTVRLYRRNSTATETAWRMVNEVAQSSTTTMLIDNTDDSSFTTNDNPYMRNGMAGIIQHQSMILGWYERDIYWSESGKPGLWKTGTWTRRLPYPITRCLSHRGFVFVMTEGNSYRLDLSDPNSAYVEEIPGSDVTLYETAASGDRGIYVVKDGLSLYDGAYFRNISGGRIKEDDFPSDGWGIYHRGFYYCFSPTTTGIIADVRGAEAVFRSTTQTAQTGYSDPRNGKLYLGYATNVYLWPDEEAQTGSDLAMEWRGGMMYPSGLGHKNVFRRAHVDYQGTGRMFLMLDGATSYTLNLTSSVSRTTKPFMLPMGTEGTQLQIKIDNWNASATGVNSLAVFSGEIDFYPRGRK